MIAKILKIYLDNMSLVGQEEDGELSWLGTNEQWSKLDRLLDEVD